MHRHDPDGGLQEVQGVVARSGVAAIAVSVVKKEDMSRRSPDSDEDDEGEEDGVLEGNLGSGYPGGETGSIQVDPRDWCGGCGFNQLQPPILSTFKQPLVSNETGDPGLPPRWVRTNILHNRVCRVSLPVEELVRIESHLAGSGAGVGITRRLLLPPRPPHRGVAVSVARRRALRHNQVGRISLPVEERAPPSRLVHTCCPTPASACLPTCLPA